jgi:hypothetical protein
MSPIFIIFSLVAIAMLIVSSVLKSIRRKKENLFLRLSLQGTQNNLTFCSQEILQNKVIGIDGIHRKIMIVEKIKKNYNYSVISLDEVQNCELVTTSGVFPNDIKKTEKDNTTQAVELLFEFKDHARPASIIFYNGLVNSKKEFFLLKAKAAYWNVMLSKLLTRQATANAAA